VGFQGSIRMGGLDWGRIGWLEGVAWLGAEAGAGALIVGSGLDGFQGGFLTEDQGPRLD